MLRWERYVMLNCVMINKMHARRLLKGFVLSPMEAKFMQKKKGKFSVDLESLYFLLRTIIAALIIFLGNFI